MPSRHSLFNVLIQCKLFEMNKWKEEKKTSLTTDNDLVNQFVTALANNQDRFGFQRSSHNYDQYLYDYYAPINYQTNSIAKQLYQRPSIKPTKLQLPKNNSLTDSMLRSTLGCEDTLANSYIKLIDDTQKHEQIQNKQRAQKAKKKYADSNSHKDFTLNSKPFMGSVKFALHRPVMDNQHEGYLKTQLIFLQQPKGSAVNTKEYFDKHTDLIAKKINELGGMEDTIGSMQASLSKNQVKSFKKKLVLAEMNQDRKKLFSPQKNSAKGEPRSRQSWIDRSKQMRESFMSKFQIE